MIVRFLTSARGRRVLLAALVVYVAVGAAVWIRRTEDFGGYVWAGDSVLVGRHIYADPPPDCRNTWPPFFSVLAVPLALLDRVSPYLSRGTWILANLWCLLFILRTVTRWTYGRELRLAAETPDLSLAAPEVLVPFLLTDRFVMTNLDHLQVNLLLFALVLWGLVLSEESRPGLGGLAIGLAAALKLMPLAFVPYLVLRKRFRAAAVAAVSFILLSLSPILVFGKDRFLWYVQDWRVVLSEGWGVGKMNQSVFAMWDRIVGWRLMPLVAPGENFIPTSGSMVALGGAALTLLLVSGFAIAAFLRPRGGGPGSAVAGTRAALTEWGVVFIVAAVFGPVAWKAYLAVLLIPNMLLFATWRDANELPRKRKTAGRLLVTATILGWIASPGLVGRGLSSRLEILSVVTLGALVLLGGMLWLRFRAGPAVQSTAPATSGR